MMLEWRRCKKQHQMQGMTVRLSEVGWGERSRKERDFLKSEDRSSTIGNEVLKDDYSRELGNQVDL